MSISIKPGKRREDSEKNRQQLENILNELCETEKRLADSMAKFVNALEMASTKIERNGTDETFLQSVIDIYKNVASESKILSDSFSKVLSESHDVITRIEHIKKLYLSQELMLNYSNVMGLSLCVKNSFGERFKKFSEKEKNKKILNECLDVNFQGVKGYTPETSFYGKITSELAKPGQRMPRHELFSKEISKCVEGFDMVPTNLKEKINVLNNAVTESYELRDKIKNANLTPLVFNKGGKGLFLEEMEETLSVKMFQAKVLGQFDAFLKEIETQKKAYLEIFKGKESGKVPTFLNKLLSDSLIDFIHHTFAFLDSIKSEAQEHGQHEKEASSKVVEVYKKFLKAAGEPFSSQKMTIGAMVDSMKAIFEREMKEKFDSRAEWMIVDRDEPVPDSEHEFLGWMVVEQDEQIKKGNELFQILKEFSDVYHHIPEQDQKFKEENEESTRLRFSKI